MKQKPKLSESLLRITFVVSLLIIFISIFVLILGNKIPLEIINRELQSNVYIYIFFLLNISIFLSLTGTIKQCKSILGKTLVVIATTIFVGVISFYLIKNLFKFGFGNWVTYSILYQHKKDNRQILEQIYDIGALGYGEKRIVEIKPILNIWNKIELVDTSKIEKSEWIFVDKQGDIKFP